MEVRNSEVEIKGNECVTEYRDATCGDPAAESHCDAVVTLSQDVVDCFWDDGAGAWDADTPEYIAAQCPEGGAGCTVTVAENFSPLALVDICNGYCVETCENGVQLDPTEVCCFWNTPSLAPDWRALYDELLQAIRDECPGLDSSEHRSLMTCQEGSKEVPSVWEDWCNDSDQVYAPGADILLAIDPLESYVTLISATDSTTLSVSGSGAAKTVPARFVTGAFWVDDGELDGTDLEDWVFGFRHGILLDLVSGVFTLDAASLNNAGLRGHGLVDTTAMKALVGASNDAHGIIDAGTQQWELDYSESLAGKQILVHLEGPWAAAP